MKTALITGINGQDGSYLSKLLLNKSYKVIGLMREEDKNQLQNLEYLGVVNDIELIFSDMLDITNLCNIMKKYKPDEIYNLAAQSSVGLSFEQPLITMEFNIFSVSHLLESIRTVNTECRFYQASSSEMFGNVRKEHLPVTEDFEFHPVSPYGISKATAHWITVNYREAYHLFAVNGILFNHESALRGKNFVTKKIITTAINISRGKEKELRLGNLNVSRDWGYAPKYVEAMWLILQQKTFSDMIICSGEAHSLEDFTRTVFQILNLDYENHVIIDRNLYRPVDLEIIYGNNKKAKEILGWDYNIKFHELIEKLINDEIDFMNWEQKRKK